MCNKEHARPNHLQPQVPETDWQTKEAFLALALPEARSE